MTTNFALSLSIDGIELLHRVQHGWKRVGTANVEDANLDAALTDLRQKALALAPDGLRTKLIVPMDQIKYIAIDSTQTNMEDVLALLEGATPYRLDELAIDSERFGGRTHIAAVARETLAEAEAFAHAHGFNPVCFVAVPEPFTFQKEVFFGPTTMMKDILGFDGVVDRDPLPVMVVGTRIKSRLLVFDLPDDMLPPDESFDLAAALAPHVSDAPAADPAPVASDQQAEEVASTEVEVEEVAPLQLDEPVSVAAPVAKPQFIDRIVPEFHAPVPVVADIAAEVAPVEVVAEVAEVAPAEITAEPAQADLLADLVPAKTIALIPKNPVFAQNLLLDRIIAEVRPRPAPVSAKPAVPVATSSPEIVVRRPNRAVAASSAARAPAPAHKLRKPLMAAGVVAACLALIGIVAWSQMTGPVATDVSATDAELVAPGSDPITAALIEAAANVPQIDIADFIVAADAAEPIAAPGMTISPPARIVPQVLATAVVPDALPAPVQQPPAPPEQQTAQAVVGVPVLRGRVLSPADAARIYDATGVWQRAPRIVDVPQETSTEGLIRPVTVDVPGRVSQPAVPLAGDIAPDLSFLAPANPPAADVQFPMGADGFILATPEGTLTPEGAVVIAGAPDLTLRLRPTLSQADLDRMALLAPAPEDVIIIAGSPDVIPPLRPAYAALPEPQLDVAEADANGAVTGDLPTPGAVALSGLQNGQTDELIASADPALEGARPETRPSALASTAPLPDPGTPDITAILEGIEAEEALNAFVEMTPQAVAASLRPAPRPNNFSRVVAAAREREQARQRAAAAAAAATPTPAPAPQQAAAPVAPQNYAPVPGGVARAATQTDAIRLREINLIGVYGRTNARRALVRLGNGRYVRVEVGSALDGGQVTAIGEEALNYVKRGRTYALELPGS